RRQETQDQESVMERAMNYRSGMPIDVTRHAEPGPQSL
ncbi:L,D-transpeptidase, partial [Klebsiella pneumoniae]